MDPPGEFQSQPERVPEPGDQTSRTDPVVPVSEPEIEDLSDTTRYPPDLSDTPMNPPPAEASSEDGGEPPDQVDFPSDTRPYRAAARERTANRRGRARCFEPTCNRLTTPDQNSPKRKESDNKTRSWFPTTLVSCTDDSSS